MRTLTVALISANWGPKDRVAHLFEETELADEVGLYVLGIVEHLRAEFLAQKLAELHPENAAAYGPSMVNTLML
jgi:hypothetical protein